LPVANFQFSISNGVEVAVGLSKLEAFNGMVFAGVAGGRGGGAGCHNATSFMRHYTRPGMVKKAASCKG
jgi:hypothetical protein